MSKYIIIDPEDGIFLGTTGRKEVSGYRDLPPQADIIALFSSDNIFDLTKAAAFPNKDDAERYMNTYILRRSPKAFVAEVNAADKNSPFVDLVDIIKSGYGDYTGDMIDAIPMTNQLYH